MLRSLLLCVLLLTSCHREMSLQDVNGQKHVLSQLKGKWVLLHYWASWCSSCVTEIPRLNQFSKTADPKQVIVLSVNYDSLSKDELKALVTTLKIQFPVLVEDPKNYFKIDNVPALPANFLFNPSLKLEKTVYGPLTDEGFKTLFNPIKISKRD